MNQNLDQLFCYLKPASKGLAYAVAPYGREHVLSWNSRTRDSTESRRG
ncbi:hypothetical Protein YC6258_04402 [Gynuella sunshinyii YC6258]|uniref:Uncharacterized protein n=1 Tax=Gynuella sunshinyii YC6258 TaxID=1445510 RepID=A0A0C5W164_9GAMM|nr:hypothetical Protein YC6258_04402 [Gynuella sunshinyii YC6258]